ncbi:hypothetical protein [Elioraea rosea]|uniref:hypothetical protein n=1 Tax=Elioraea rosea TaxID=2492390 RepID=UPI00118376F3|nr:hypothetical protein [Elioraea rosea]
MPRPLSPARLVLWLLLALAACGPSIPREQVQRANAAYEAVAGRSDAMLANLSVAERRTYLRTLAATGAPRDGDIVVPTVFDPTSAAYFSSVGDPVLTASLRRGMGLVGDYFKLLVMLAEGRPVEEAKGQINALAGSVAGLITVATGGAALPLAALARQLGPLIDGWGRAQNGEELRRLVLEGEPIVREQIAAMQAASTAAYETLTREPMRAVRTTLADNDAARRAAFVQMAEAQVLVADYVVLLDKLAQTLTALAAAVRNPGSPPTLASLSASADSALIQARAAEGAIAILKAGRTP